MVYVYSSVRWTSCCCVSWCRAAQHRRLLETGERRKEEFLGGINIEKHQMVQKIKCYMDHPVHLLIMYFLTFSKDDEQTVFNWCTMLRVNELISPITKL